MRKPVFDPVLTWSIRLILALTMAVTLWQGTAIAQDAGANDAESRTVIEPDSTFIYPVVIDGIKLFSVRGTTALPADTRSENIQNQLLNVAEASSATWSRWILSSGIWGIAFLRMVSL